MGVCMCVVDLPRVPARQTWRPQVDPATYSLTELSALTTAAPLWSTQPSIPPGSVNEYQLRLGRRRQVWLIPIADERVDVQVKL